MKVVVYLSLLLVSITSVYAGQSDKRIDKNTLHAIESVVEVFDKAIVNKDREAFLALFTDPDKKMMAIFSDDIMKNREALVAKINKEEGKNLVATKSFTMSPTQMIENKLKRKTASKQQISNIKINTDGNIANVYFDYVYYIDGKKNNWGNESWQLVKTLKGWKINSVVYSIVGSV